MKFRPYSVLDNIITTCQPNEVIVEVGSDTGSYSTIYFAQLANKLGTKLYSVDIDNSIDKSDYFTRIPSNNVIFCNCSGETFGSDIIPNLNVSIKCLLLDNLDFIEYDHRQIFNLDNNTYQNIRGSDWPEEFSNIEELPNIVQKELEENYNIGKNGIFLYYDDQYLKDRYLEKFKMQMTNHNSLLTHLHQMILLLPYMADESYIVCDRTKYVKQGMYEGYYYGKNGLVIPFLLVNNYVITHELDDVIILKKWCP